MDGGFVNRITGTRGEIRSPELGVLICEMKTPLLLRRRADDGRGTDQFDLHAAVSYFNQALWDDPDWTKVIVVWLGKDPLKVTLTAESKVIIGDKSLRIEGVHVQ